MSMVNPPLIKINTKDKFSWILCTIFSLVYFIIFILSVLGISDRFGKGLTDGFCVWGNPQQPPGTECPVPENSHQFSWYIDIALAVITIPVGLFRRDRTLLRVIQTFGMTAIILGHGYLHKSIAGQDRPCLLGNEGGNSFFYSVYVTALVLATIFFGFPQLPFLKKILFIGVITGSYLAIVLRGNLPTQYNLASLFALSHPMVSIVGLFSESPMITPQLGWAFLVATLVGLVEFTRCEVFLLGIGGHVWYDFSLHVSIISMLYFAPPDTQGYEIL